MLSVLKCSLNPENCDQKYLDSFGLIEFELMSMVRDTNSDKLVKDKRTKSYYLLKYYLLLFSAFFLMKNPFLLENILCTAYDRIVTVIEY